MASNLDRNSLQTGPKFDPSHELLAKIPEYSSVPSTMHPAGVLPSIVSDIDPKAHLSALAAFTAAVDAQHAIYRSLSVLGDSRAALEPYSLSQGLKGSPVIPGAGTRWNDQAQKYRENASKVTAAAIAAHDRAEENLAKISQALEADVANAVTVRLPPHVESELRAHIKSKNTAAKPNEAQYELDRLITGKDLAALSAVRAAPAFLSGLSDENVKNAAEKAALLHAPDLVLQRDTVAKLRAALRNSRGILEDKFSEGMTFATPVEIKRPQGYSENPRVRQ